MKCPYCGQDEDRVIDSRTPHGGETIRRRRECLACSRRFTTYERIETGNIRIVKKDGSRAPYDREKILGGILKACEKRPVSQEEIEGVVGRIEAEIYNKYDREVPAQDIGELVIRELKRVDQVAYVRFASVYREFQDIEDFASELKAMIKQGKKKRQAGKPAPQ